MDLQSSKSENLSSLDSLNSVDNPPSSQNAIVTDEKSCNGDSEDKVSSNDACVEAMPMKDERTSDHAISKTEHVNHSTTSTDSTATSKPESDCCIPPTHNTGDTERLSTCINSDDKDDTLDAEVNGTASNGITHENCIRAAVLPVDTDDQFLISSLQLSNGNCVSVENIQSDLNETQTSHILSQINHMFNFKPLSSQTGNESELKQLTESNKKMSGQILELTHTLKQTEDKLKSHDTSAKRAISRLQTDSEAKIRELSKKCSSLETDKQASVMNYAKREKELMDLKRLKLVAEEASRKSAQDRDKAYAQLKSVKADLMKLKENLTRKEKEVKSMQSENGKLKDDLNSQAIKVRWAQNKLKTEMDSHKVTKEKCDKMISEIKQAKEETEQIRMNCQTMINTYQESEEMKSNALDIELHEKLKIITEKDASLITIQTLHNQKVEELKSLKIKLHEFDEENKVLQLKLSKLDEEKKEFEERTNTYEQVLNKQKLNATELNEKLNSLMDVETELEEAKSSVAKLEHQIQDLTSSRDNALADLEYKTSREQELLHFTEKVSSKNSMLSVQIEELTAKLSDDKDNKDEIIRLKNQIDLLSTQNDQEQKVLHDSEKNMTAKLQDKEKTIEQLLIQVEECKDELKTMKRKNAASLKDLTRQLNQARKKIDNATDGTSAGSSLTPHDDVSMGSRASSSSSLDRIAGSYHNHIELSNGSSSSPYDAAFMPTTAVVSGPGHESQERQMLIERIVRLQQIHAKKNEKIDFLNEHIHQLVSEMQRKQRLIQYYILREEAGVLAPPKLGTDPNKPKPALTLDLSIEINQKMQSVLEDTILKNITLKESLEMLGKEIQRLQPIIPP